MKRAPANLLNAVDKLNHAKNLFEAALMAVADIDDRRQSNALDAILTDALAALKGRHR
jgi:hypothetical protein